MARCSWCCRWCSGAPHCPRKTNQYCSCDPNPCTALPLLVSHGDTKSTRPSPSTSTVDHRLQLDPNSASNPASAPVQLPETLSADALEIGTLHSVGWAAK